jgi:hypothetical protein
MKDEIWRVIESTKGDKLVKHKLFRFEKMPYIFLRIKIILLAKIKDF